MPRDLLENAEWRHRYDDEALHLGQKLATQANLKKLHLEAIDDSYQASAQCQSDEPVIDFFPLGDTADGPWDFETDCSCSDGPGCAHTAALLIKLSKPNAWDRLAKSVQRDQKAAAVAQIQPNPKIEVPVPKKEVHRPVFSLSLQEEDPSSRAAKLLLQALKLPPRERWLVARPTVRYGATAFPLSKTPADHPTIERDKAAEQQALDLLRTTGLTNLHAHPQYRFLLAIDGDTTAPDSTAHAWFPEPHAVPPARFWPTFRAHSVPLLEKDGWSVSVTPDFGHHVLTLETADLDADLSPRGGGWFNLSVGVDLAGKKVDLLPVLRDLLGSDAIAQLNHLPPDAPYLIHLPASQGGGALQVPAGRLRLLLTYLATLSQPGAPAVHPLDAAALVESGTLGLSEPPELAHYRELLQAAGPDQKADLPTNLRAELRPYQADGYQWLQTLARTRLNGILADDMGLGKTLQTLAFLLAQHQFAETSKPALIVAPTSVVPNWLVEIEKFTPDLNALVLQGPQRRRLFPKIGTHQVVLTSYALLHRDLAELKKHTFRAIILDEAQHIKNPDAQVTKAAGKLLADHRFCLSGTPVENNLGELWSLFNFLMPGFLGSQEYFNTTYRTPIEKDGNDELRLALQRRLSPLILRRTKSEVAKDLPPKTILTHSIDLSSHQRDLYETVRGTMDKKVREAIALRGLEESQFAILSALLKLRQICCHPQLVENSTTTNPDEPVSAKLAYLLDLLDILLAEGRRVLLFSQFTSMLEIIEAELAQRDIETIKLTGESKDRGELVRRYQESDIPVFLISLKAGGTGLNLTAADTVIHFDPWWNPAAENQATDRAYRIGQKNPVFVHKLICTRTVEDKIAELQAAKAALADGLLSAATQIAPTPTELLQLFAEE